MAITGKVISEGLNVHCKARASSKIVDGLKRGDIVTVLNTDFVGKRMRLWYRIGNNRWVDASFVDIIKKTEPSGRPPYGADIDLPPLATDPKFFRNGWDGALALIPIGIMLIIAGAIAWFWGLF